MMTTPTKKIADLATVTPGFSAKPEERKKSAKYLLLGGRNIKDRRLVGTDADSFVDEIDRESFRRARLIPNEAKLGLDVGLDRRGVPAVEPDCGS